jgi:hypothetical protein
MVRWLFRMGAAPGQIATWIRGAEDRRGAQALGWAGFLGPDRADGRAAGDRSLGGWRPCTEVQGSRWGFEELGNEESVPGTPRLWRRAGRFSHEDWRTALRRG